MLPEVVNRPFDGKAALRSLVFLSPWRLDTNSLGEVLRARLGRVYDAAKLEEFRRSL